MISKPLRNLCLFSLIIVLLLCNCSSALAASDATGSSQTGASSPFSDVKKDDPNRIFITYVNQRGIISGFPDGTYHPQSGLTRAQAAVVICKAAGLQTSSASTSTFNDVPANHWAISYINAADQAGYLKGMGDGTYQPDARLTRAQGISLIMRLCTQKERASLPALQDMNNQHWAAKDMATALSLEMISTSKDGNQIYPDAEITRAALARSLAILLTKDPGLNQAKLTGTLKEIKGDVTLTRNNKTEILKNDITVCEADIIKTGPDGRVRIVYPDGSGNLIEENSEIVIKQADGKSYIKQDGTAGVAVEYLNIDLKKGTLFGALSTKTENKDGNKQAGLSSMFASRRALAQLAAAEPTQPWYKTAEKKQVKVKVDMPWGVAAIRGTFIKVSVNPDGTCDVACLTGSAEVNGSGGGSTPLGGGQSSSIGSQGSTPTNAAPMSREDKSAFAQEQEWVVNTALLVDTNKAAEVLVETAENQTVEQQTETTVKIVIDALKASGIELKPEVIDKLKEDIQKALVDEKIAESLTKDVNGSNNNNSNSNSHSNGSNSSAYIAYDTAGTYGGESASAVLTVAGSAIINVPGVTLHNLIITGTLTLASSIGEGNVTLQNVTVQGNTIINGGGPNSIQIIDSNLYTVTVDKANNSIRIVAKGNTSIGALTLNSGATLEESSLNSGAAGFSSVLTGLTIPTGAKVILSGNFDSVTLNAAGCEVTLAAGTSVQTLTVNAAASIGGSGQIARAVINAAGVTLAQVPLSWSIASGSAIIGGQTQTGSGGAGSAKITATTVGSLIEGNIVAVPSETKVSALKAGLSLSPNATAEILESLDGPAVADPQNTNVDSAMVIRVTAQDGTKVLYGITCGEQPGEPVASLPPNNDTNANNSTTLSATFTQPLFKNGTALKHGEDITASFAYLGTGSLISAIYRIDKTVVFTIANGASSGDRIIHNSDATALMNSEGKKYPPRIMTFDFDDAEWSMSGPVATISETVNSNTELEVAFDTALYKATSPTNVTALQDGADITNLFTGAVLNNFTATYNAGAQIIQFTFSLSDGMPQISYSPSQNGVLTDAAVNLLAPETYFFSGQTCKWIKKDSTPPIAIIKTPVFATKLLVKFNEPLSSSTTAITDISNLLSAAVNDEAGAATGISIESVENSVSWDCSNMNGPIARIIIPETDFVAGQTLRLNFLDSSVMDLAKNAISSEINFDVTIVTEADEAAKYTNAGNAAVIRDLLDENAMDLDETTYKILGSTARNAVAATLFETRGDLTGSNAIQTALDDTIANLAMNDTWLPVGKAGFSAGQVDYMQMAIDTDGLPSVVYQDQANGDKATVMRYSDGEWVNVGTAGFSSGTPYAPKIALSGNTPYIAYRDGGASYKCTVMQYIGEGETGWAQVGGSFASDQSYETAFCTDSDGIPYALICDWSSGSKFYLAVYQYSDGEWQKVGPDFATQNNNQIGGISIRTDGTVPYVAYSDYSTGSNQLKVVTFVEGNWVGVGNGGLTGYINNNSLFISQGTVYLAYQDYAHSNRATVVRLTKDSTWETIGAAGFSSDEVGNISIAVNGGIPFVAYGEGTENPKAIAKAFYNNQWNDLGALADAPANIHNNSLSVYNGVPYMSFQDQNGKATVMRLTTILAAAPSNIVLAGAEVANVKIPTVGGTDRSGWVGWYSNTEQMTFTVTDSGSATSTITINGETYTSGDVYTITSPGTLTIEVTTTESGKQPCVRTFEITVLHIT